MHQYPVRVSSFRDFPVQHIQQHPQWPLFLEASLDLPAQQPEVTLPTLQHGGVLGGAPQQVGNDLGPAGKGVFDSEGCALFRLCLSFA